MSILDDRTKLEDMKQRWKEIATSSAYVKDYSPVVDYLKACILAWFYDTIKADTEEFEIKLYLNERVEDSLIVYYKNGGNSKYANQVSLFSGKIKKITSTCDTWNAPFIDEFVTFYYSMLKEITNEE